MSRKMIQTVPALAAACGCNESLLYRMRRQGALPPGIPHNPPWNSAHVTKLRRWLADRSAPRSRRPADDELDRARLRRLNIKNAILSGELIERAPVERRQVEAASRCRSALLALPRHVAPELVGVTDMAEIHRTLIARLTKIADEYAAYLAGGPLPVDDGAEGER